MSSSIDNRNDLVEQNDVSQFELDKLPEFLTVPELARLLRVTNNTIYDLFSRKEIPGGRRLGKRAIRFHRDTVLEWFCSQGCDSPPSGSER